MLVFFSDVRLTTSVILSMKWYVSEQEVMDFQFLKKKEGKKRGICVFFDRAKRPRLSSEQQKARIGAGITETDSNYQ